MEFQTLIQDLNSLISQLQQMISSESGPAMQPDNPLSDQQPDAEKGTGTTEDDQMIEKGLETTPSDGATANDNSDTRVADPQTPQGDVNEKEVTKATKALLEMLQKNNQNKGIQKSISNPDTQVLNTLNEIVKVTKSLTEKVNDQEIAMKNILEGLGVVEQVEKSYQIDNNNNNQVQKGLRNQNDFNNALEIITKALQVKPDTSNTYQTPREVARKTFQNPSILTAMLKK
jgi:hypothetical protein